MKVSGMNIVGVIRVDNAYVYGLHESIIASGYPMSTEAYKDMEDIHRTDADLKRVKHLGNAAPGSGHDCFLKGITVQFDLQVPEYIWRQLDRYHFIDYVSSQSKMHRILKLDLDEMCNKYVTEETLVNVKKYIEQYNSFDFYYNAYIKQYKEDCALRKVTADPNWVPTLKLRNGHTIEYNKENLFRIIVANCPCGLMLTARMTTNYLQLKSMINQRSNHKMQEWRYLTAWFKGLPHVDRLLLNQK